MKRRNGKKQPKRDIPRTALKVGLAFALACYGMSLYRRMNPAPQTAGGCCPGGTASTGCRPQKLTLGDY
jgi:hypothetical protein